MDSNLESRVLWSFWIACGLAATGAIVQFVPAGGDVGGALGAAIPFGIAAVLLGIIGRTYPRGKSLATALYILAWIAIVYAILRMLAVPLQQVAIGLCPASLDCSPGFSHPFGTGETIVIVVGIITGALALQVGYFGLRSIYRRESKHGPASYASAPPTRVIPQSRPPATQPPPAPEPPAASPSSVPEPATGAVPAPQPARKPRAARRRMPAGQPASSTERAELPAPAEPAELPAHAEPAELPAPAEQGELPPHAGTS